MFESISEKLQGVFDRLGKKGKLTEKDVDEALREVRLALLEADVNFKVVRTFVARVRERAVGIEVLESLTPAQQVVKIVNEEMVGLLGESARLSTAPSPPTVIMLVGLQGSGKTTTASKVALHLRKLGQMPLLVAADPYRPAAITQLQVLGKQLDIPVYTKEGASPPDVCIEAVREARSTGRTPVILDTAGRLHIDDELMAELAQIKRRTTPTEVLLVVDAMTGQDAVKVAEAFHQRVGLTGLVLTKMDGDARGGAALSIREVSGVPIKFLGTGERPEALELFHPDRLASRILGMGDVLSLIERAQEVFDQDRAQELQKKMRTATFDLEDFLDQMQQVRKLGPMSQLVDMIPGMSRAMKHSGQASIEEGDLKQIEAIILSMTPHERQHPEIIGGSRRKRIAKGSGTSAADVNQLLNQFKQAQQMMKAVAGGKVPRNMAHLFR
ncbi:MAG: signal recognition particle protein [Chloroflexi bacterium]|nr:signal recognition particle protein [Chloroflexota bacterium]